jgi:hypothetical protein
MTSPTYQPAVWSRLRMHRNPVRMAFSSGVWASAWYLFSYLIVGTVLFAVILALAAASVGLSILWAGLVLLMGVGFFVRGCVHLERGRARAVVPEGLPAVEPLRTAEGFFGTLSGIWDRTTWRGVAYFIGLYVPLFVLDLVVTVVWLVFLGMVTLPVWYRYPPQTFDDGTTAHGVSFGYFPHGPHGSGHWGFWIGSTTSAAVAAAVGVVLLLLWNYVLVATARAHVNAVRMVVADVRDPLAEARHVLEVPGPLGSSRPVAN